MTRSRLYLFVTAVLIAAAAIAILFILDARAVQSPNNDEPTALPLTHNFDKSPTGFTFYYPDEWQYTIPSVGLLVLGPPETVNEGAPGPTLTVQRAEPLSVVGDLEGAMDRYLNNGPLRVPDLWKVTQESRATNLDGREARIVDLEGAAVPDGLPVAMRVIVTAADNSLVYLFVTTMPLADHAQYEPTMDAILATMHILE